MLEPFHNDMLTCSQKVCLALAEKGLDWKKHYLNLKTGDQQKPNYIKLNPNAFVPTLLDEGKVLIESTVINKYLDDAYLEHPLCSKDACEGVRMCRWTKQFDEGVHAATGILSMGIAFRYQRLAQGPEVLESMLKKMSDPGKHKRSREGITKGVDASFFPPAIKRFDKLLGDVETR
jgi:glutathione S-transferase